MGSKSSVLAAFHHSCCPKSKFLHLRRLPGRLGVKPERFELGQVIRQRRKPLFVYLGLEQLAMHFIARTYQHWYT